MIHYAVYSVSNFHFRFFPMKPFSLLISIYRHQCKTYNHQHCRSPYCPLVINFGTISANTCPESKEQDNQKTIMYFDNILVFFCPDVCRNRCDKTFEVTDAHGRSVHTSVNFFKRLQLQRTCKRYHTVIYLLCYMFYSASR